MQSQFEYVSFPKQYNQMIQLEWKLDPGIMLSIWLVMVSSTCSSSRTRLAWKSIHFQVGRFETSNLPNSNLTLTAKCKFFLEVHLQIFVKQCRYANFLWLGLKSFFIGILVSWGCSNENMLSILYLWIPKYINSDILFISMFPSIIFFQLLLAL